MTPFPRSLTMRTMKKPHTHHRREEANLCNTCGNELPQGAATCPFCKSPQLFSAVRKPASQPVVTINLKQGLPTVDEAMTRLSRELDAAVAGGARLIKIIHGWGSGGKGGAIRDETRRRLAALQRQHRVGTVVHGEDFGDRTAGGRQVLSRAPPLRDDRSNFGNPGITIVAL